MKIERVSHSVAELKSSASAICFLSLFARCSLATKLLKFGHCRRPTSQVSFCVTRWSFCLGFRNHHWLPMWQISASHAILVSSCLSPAAVSLSLCLWIGWTWSAAESGAKQRRQQWRLDNRKQVKELKSRLTAERWVSRNGRAGAVRLALFVCSVHRGMKFHYRNFLAVSKLEHVLQWEFVLFCRGNFWKWCSYAV